MESKKLNIDEIREFGKECVDYGRHLALFGREKANTVLHFWMEGYEKCQSDQTASLEAELVELRKAYGFLEAKYGDVINQRQRDALDGQTTMEEAYNTISELKAQIAGMVEALTEVETYMGQEMMLDEYDGVWRDDDDVIFERVKSALSTHTKEVKPVK